MWVVDEAPVRRLGHGQLISLQNDDGQTGPGILTAITDLRRHWITWSVAGGPGKTLIRVPVPWTAMTGVEAIAHVKHYQALPASPPPHGAAPPPPIPFDDEQSCPYTHDLDEYERSRLESRLHDITKRKWEWRPEERRTRRRKELMEEESSDGKNWEQ